MGDPLALGYTRTYSWAIGQSVKKAALHRPAGHAALRYRIAVSQTGFTDSRWHLAGKIRLNNPGPLPLKDVTITDAVDNGGTCTVARGLRLTIPGARTIWRTYACAWTTAPTATHGVDTVTASWDTNANGATGAVLTSHTSFAFTAPTAIQYGMATTVDTYSGVLGAMPATNTAPYSAHAYTYTRTVRIPLQCATYINTASIAQTHESARTTVDVCGSRNRSIIRAPVRKVARSAAHTGAPLLVLPQTGGGGAAPGPSRNGTPPFWLILLAGGACLVIGRRLASN